MRRGAVASAAAVLALVFGGGAALAATGPQAPPAGYWWSGQATSYTLPPPPQVPTNGLYISSNALGPQAISAVRVTGGGRGDRLQLVLGVHSLTIGDSFDVAAYPVQSSWSPGPAQPWADRPAYGTGTPPSAAGVLSADHTTVSFDLSALATGAPGSADVVLAPVPSSSTTGGGQYPTFDVSFEPVTTAAVHVTAVPPPPSRPTTVATGRGASSFPSPASSPAAQDFAPPQTDAAAASSGSVFSTSGSSAVAAAAPSIASPVGRAATGEPIANRPGVATRSISALPKVETGRTSQVTILLAFLLADVIAYMLWFGRTRGRGGGISIYDLPMTDSGPVTDSGAVTEG